MRKTRQRMSSGSLTAKHQFLKEKKKNRENRGQEIISEIFHEKFPIKKHSIDSRLKGPI